uniref:Uncharacterized protein n=1 Tax=Chenopodium quinoa TaxID=63459 RepID=A0A803N1E3_CHEQI
MFKILLILDGEDEESLRFIDLAFTISLSAIAPLILRLSPDSALLNGRIINEGHSRKCCKIRKELAKRRLKSVAALENQGMRILYGPREYSYCTNVVKGLPNYRCYRDPEANLVRPKEPEDVPMEDKNLTGDGDSNSDDFSNDSAGSDYSKKILYRV